MNQTGITPMFFVEHVAERARTACTLLIWALVIYIVLLAAPIAVLFLIRTTGVPGLAILIPPRWIGEALWLVPAAVGVTWLDHAVRTDRDDGYWRWFIVAGVFWLCGVLGFFTRELRVLEAVWWVRLAMFGLSVFWMREVVRDARTAVQGAWPGVLSVQIAGITLIASLFGQLAVLAIASTDLVAYWRPDVLPLSPMQRESLQTTGVIVQIAAWFFWLPVLLPVLIVNRSVIARMSRGRCLRCGFDVRGDLHSGCPECGWRRAGFEQDAESHATQ